MPEELRSRLEALISALQQVKEDFQEPSKVCVEPSVLADFRAILDAVRLHAWSVHELTHVREARENPKAVLCLLARERLKRFEQMANDICTDLDSGILKRDSALKTLEFRMAAIGRRLTA